MRTDSNMTSAEDESWASIEMWILEHACKERMERVIDDIITKRGDDITFLKKPAGGISLSNYQHQQILLSVQLRRLQNELVKFEEEVSCKLLSCSFDDTLTLQTVQLLDDVYSKDHFLPLKVFINIFSRLKMLVLVFMMIKKIDSKIILKDMANFFPRANESLRHDLQSRYRIENLQTVEKMMSCLTCCRKYVVQFMFMSENKKEDYIKETLPDDLLDFISMARKYIDETQVYNAQRLKTSPLERILQGAYVDLSHSDDPYIQILLKNLKSEVTEDSLLHILEELRKERRSNGARNVLPRNDNVANVRSAEKPSIKEETATETLNKSSVDTTPSSKESGLSRTPPRIKKALEIKLRASSRMLAERYLSPEKTEEIVEQISPTPVKSKKRNIKSKNSDYSPKKIQ